MSNLFTHEMLRTAMIENVAFLNANLFICYFFRQTPMDVSVKLFCAEESEKTEDNNVVGGH